MSLELAEYCIDWLGGYSSTNLDVHPAMYVTEFQSHRLHKNQTYYY